VHSFASRLWVKQGEAGGPKTGGGDPTWLGPLSAGENPLDIRPEAPAAVAGGTPLLASWVFFAARPPCFGETGVGGSPPAASPPFPPSRELLLPAVSASVHTRKVLIRCGLSTPMAYLSTMPLQDS